MGSPAIAMSAMSLNCLIERDQRVNDHNSSTNHSSNVNGCDYRWTGITEHRLYYRVLYSNSHPPLFNSPSEIGNNYVNRAWLCNFERSILYMCRPTFSVTAFARRTIPSCAKDHPECILFLLL